MSIRLVGLDAGFTLLSPKRSLGEALRGVVAARGHAVSEPAVRRAWEVANRWWWQEYHRPGNDTWGDDARIDQHWREYHSLMLAELGLADQRFALLDTILEAQYAVEAWELYPDVEPALAALRARPGLRLAILSDWGSNLGTIVTALGLSARVDFVQASGAVGFGKADPAFYRLALERAGVAADEAVMVGDSVFADVLGARAAGMEGVLLRRERVPISHQPVPRGVQVIRSLAELPALIG